MKKKNLHESKKLSTMKKSKKIFLPEDHFNEVPDSFSSESQIVKVESLVNTNGIILDSIKDVELVLRVHNGEKEIAPLSSLATKMDLVKSMSDAAGPMGGCLAIIANQTFMEGVDFVGTMVAEAKSHLATKGSYYRSYDYDAMGSSFFKTSVTIKKVEDKFVLSINAAYVGNKSEAALAALIGRNLVVANVRIIALLSVVDNWWYNTNLPNILHDLNCFDSAIEIDWFKVADDLAGENNRFYLQVVKNGVPLILTISAGYSATYKCLVNNRDYVDRDLIKAIGENIAGASWNQYYDKEAGVQAEPKELSFILSFDKKDENGLIIDQAKTEALISAAKAIEEKLSAQVK